MLQGSRLAFALSILFRVLYASNLFRGISRMRLDSDNDGIISGVMKLLNLKKVVAGVLSICSRLVQASTLQGLGFRVQGSGLRGWGLRSRI